MPPMFPILGRVFRVPAYAAGLMSYVALAASNAGADQIQFNRDIRPILSDNCFFCHGPDANKREADLRLDVRDDAGSWSRGATVIPVAQEARSVLFELPLAPDVDPFAAKANAVATCVAGARSAKISSKAARRSLPVAWPRPGRVPSN